MKNVLFVSHCHFPENSAVHVHHFANELVRLGLDCVVAVPNDQTTRSKMMDVCYTVTQFDAIAHLPHLFANHQPPEIVHAWTPREHVRRYCYELASHYVFKQFIHLEDNEECILERSLNQSMPFLLAHPETVIPFNLSHPEKYQRFLAAADGVTVIMDRLQEFVPPQVPTLTLWPGVDPQQFFPRSPNPALAKQLGIPEQTTVISYIGNVYPVNQAEVRSLYRAVGLRNQAGHPTVLVRTGLRSALLPEDAWIQPYVIELGYVDRALIPEILALADVLVQPGQSDAFNDYRFPSKIPEFLAMGKPLIVPATNIGRFLDDRQQAIVLPVVDESGLVAAIDDILQHPVLAKTLSEGARQFAQARLNWAASAQQLFQFYQQVAQPSEDRALLSTHKALQRAQGRVHDVHDQLQHVTTEKAQAQIHGQQVQDALLQTQTQLQQAQDDLAQAQLNVTHLHAELAQAQTQVHTLQAERSRDRAHSQHTQDLLAQARERIAAMESSKFWKLRMAWTRLKEKIRGGAPP